MGDEKPAEQGDMVEITSDIAFNGFGEPCMDVTVCGVMMKGLNPQQVQGIALYLLQSAHICDHYAQVAQAMMLKGMPADTVAAAIRSQFAAVGQS